MGPTMPEAGEITRYHDSSLVVRIGTKIYVIPKSALDSYANKGLASQGKRALDAMFAAYRGQPQVDAVLIPTVHIMGGG
jgi:hypothetical protein